MSAITLSVAVFGAFAFTNVEKKALLAPETGWINLTGAPCSVEVACDNDPSRPMCTAIYQGISHQVFGKLTPNAATCTKVLYRVQ